MTYTYRIDVDLERGAHEIALQVNNIWKIISTEPVTIHAAYDETVHEIAIYQGDRRLDATDITIHDAELPDCPTLAFTLAEEIAGHVTAVVRERGRKEYDCIIEQAQKGNGTFTYEAVAAERDLLEEEREWIVPAGTAANVLPSLLPSLRIVGADHIQGTLTRQKISNASCQNLIEQILTAGFCSGHVRRGTLWIAPRDVATADGVLAFGRNDPDVSWSASMRTYKRVRTHYANILYPVPETALTEYDADNWTGTISNVATSTAEGLPPVSGAMMMLKATGAVSRAGLNAALSDFDRLRLRWKPDTATSLTIKLEQDASNYLSYTRTFAGPLGEGFAAYGAAPGDEVTKDIDVTGHRPVYIVLAMTAPCSAKAKITDAGGATLAETDWARTDAANTVRIDLPAGSYQVGGGVTLRLTFRGLTVIGTAYGVQCTSMEIYDYVSKTEWIPYETPQDAIVRRVTMTGAPSRWGYGTPYGPRYGQGITTALYRIDFGAAPSVEAGQEIRVGAFPASLYVCGQWWDAVNSHERYEYLVIDPQVVIENGKVVGYFCISYTSLFGSVGDLYSFESMWGKKVTTTLWIVAPGAGSSGEAGGTIWVVEKWNRATSYKGFDAIDIPLSSFAKTGNPLALATITLTATGVNYYDALNLYATVPVPRTAEAGSGLPLYDVRGVMFGSFDSAYAYATGMLAQVSTPARGYQRDVGMANDIDIGDVVTCDGENMVVSGITYSGGRKIIRAGRDISSANELLKGLSRRIEAVEKIIL